MNMLERVGDKIVASRLLVLQTRRILLTRAASRRSDGDTVDVQAYADAVRTAQRRYNEAVLQWASASSDQYVLVAYSSLIAKAEKLQDMLRDASDDTPGPDSRQLATEARTLETIIDGWRAVTRRSMTAAIA